MNRRQLFSRSAQFGLAAAATPWLASPAFAQEAGLTASSITIGSSGALSGPLGAFGQDLRVGIEAAMLEVNSKGGVHGRKLQLSMVDDAYAAARTAENVKKMIDTGSVFGLMSCIGTPNNGAILPMVEQAGLPYVAPLTGASSLRKEESKNVFHVRASYTDETRRLVQQLVSMGITNLAIVYLDNGFGKEVLADAKAALKAANIQATAEVALAADGKNIDDVVKATLAVRPGAVLLGTAGAASTGLVQALRRATPRTPIAGLSVALTNSGVKQLGALTSGVAITMVFPDAMRPKQAIVRQYHAAMASAGQAEVSQGGLEAYVNTRVLAEALQRSGRDLSRAKLRQALAGMRKVDMGGFGIDYASAPYVGSRFVELGVLNDKGRFTG